jgi:molecular chaperone DnaK (HSP70)
VNFVCAVGDCGTALDKSWRHCPNCGSPTNSTKRFPTEHHFATPEVHNIILPLTNDHPIRCAIALAPQSAESKGSLSSSDFSIKYARNHLIAEQRPGPVLVIKLDLSSSKDHDVLEFIVDIEEGKRSGFWGSSDSDEWVSKSSSRLVVRRISGEFKVEVWPEALFFGQQETRPIRIKATGNLGGKVTVQASTGYEANLSNSGDRSRREISLLPGQEVTVDISKVRPDAGEGNVKILDSIERPMKTIFLLNKERPSARVLPALVVAIDFGTSNTSIFALKPGQKGTPEPISIPINGKNRTRSVVSIGENITDWRYFDERLDISNPRVISDLKSIVRKGDNIQIDGREYSPTYILTNVLTFLKNRIIDPYLKETLSEGQKVEFVFTIPVLGGEGSESLDKYISVLREAASEAGFEDHEEGYSIRTTFEPNAAALEVALSAYRHGLKIKDQENLLVIDLGGGTVDVSLCKVNIDSTVWVSGFQNCLTNEDGLEFGGNFVTHRLGLNFVTDFPNRKDVFFNFAGVYEDFYRDGDSAPVVTNFDELVDQFNPRSLKDEPLFVDPHCWFNRFPDLFIKLEEAKKALSIDPTLPHYEFRNERRNSERNHIALRDSLDKVTRKTMGDIGEKIYQFLKDNNLPKKDIHHIAIVGGGSRLSLVRELFETLFSKKTILDNHYIDVTTAICKGATYLYDRNVEVFPFDLRWSVLGSEEIVISKGTAIGSPFTKIQNTSPEECASSVNVFATIKGEPCKLIDYPFSQTSSTSFALTIRSNIIELAQLSGDNNKDKTILEVYSF